MLVKRRGRNIADKKKRERGEEKRREGTLEKKRRGTIYDVSVEWLLFVRVERVTIRLGRSEAQDSNVRHLMAPWCAPLF